MHNRRFIFSNSTVRRATALLVLVGFCATALPIPLGRIVRQTKELSQPYPCQHCSCGCKNADQCWTECCCYTPAQKAAWAKENGVTPPSYAILVDETPLADARVSGKDLCTKGCCSKKSTARKSTEPPQVAKNPACPNCVAAVKCDSAACDATARLTTCADSDKGDSESESTVMVLSIMAYKCSGQATVFSLLPWAIIDTQANTALRWELSGRHAPDESFSPIRVFLFPDEPPPRAVG